MTGNSLSERGIPGRMNSGAGENLSPVQVALFLETPDPGLILEILYS